jgi:Rrf2 family protein
MNITSKSRYALKILMDLAMHPDEIVHRSDIAQRQGIPLDYMDQILIRMRESGMIESTRGRGGGYKLMKSSDKISIYEIFTSVEDAFHPVQCMEGGIACSAEHYCSSKDAWSEITSAVSATLSGIILAEIVEKSQYMKSGVTEVESVVQECRAPKRRSGGVQRDI